MFSALEKFETDIAAPYDQEAAEFRQALAVVDTDSVIPADMPPLRKPMPSKLCHLMAIYKLVDILHAMDDPSIKNRKDDTKVRPIYARMYSIGVSNKDVRILTVLSLPR
jgi:hypothetical protein